MADMGNSKGWRIENEWLSPPRRRGRPHESYKEAIDLHLCLRAEEIYREASVSPMEAIRRAVGEAWESKAPGRRHQGLQGQSRLRL